MTKHIIINGDSRKISLKNESMDLVITSPPYWDMKDYNHGDQIGFHDSYVEYVQKLNEVWKECFRILRYNRRMCINIGNKFARASQYGRYKVISIKADIVKYCESLGMDYMGAIIWQKISTTNTTGGASIMGSYPYPRNGIVKYDYEFILLFRKSGNKKEKIDKVKKEKSKMTAEEWNKYFTGHWKIPGVRQTDHIAMFPLEIPYRLIKMFSLLGDIVFDPFLGSGTTSLAALKLNRNSIGYELNKEYLPIIKNKVKDDKMEYILKFKKHFLF